MLVTVKNCNDFSVPFMSSWRYELMKKLHLSGTPVLPRGSLMWNNTGEGEGHGKSVTENRKRNRDIIKIKKYEHLFIEDGGKASKTIRNDTMQRRNENGRRGMESHRQWPSFHCI
jgi:hypothetical protein